MKKTYTTPKFRAYKIEPATLMATSDAVNRSTNLDDLGWFNDDEGTKENNIWRNRQTLWGGCTDANPKLLLNDT